MNNQTALETLVIRTIRHDFSGLVSAVSTISCELKNGRGNHPDIIRLTEMVSDRMSAMINELDSPEFIKRCLAEGQR